MRERGSSWVCVDGLEGADENADEDGLPGLVSTSTTGYLRLRRADYDEATLAAWAARIHDQTWERAFVFFKHEDAGAGPRMAAAFREAFEREAARRRPRRVARRRKAEERETG